MAGKAVIIVAGGTGTRMKSKVAKQFLTLGEKPMIIHTLEAFKRYDQSIRIVLVLFPGLEKEWEDIRERWFDHSEIYATVPGGAERFHSVRNGLDALGEGMSPVAIHDAVRPLVSAGTIERCFSAAEEFGAAIPVVPVVDTIRHMTGKSGITLPRNELVAVQTPQCFRTDLIKAAYATEFRATFTDDASVAEYAGYPVTTVEGNRTNIKITTPEDLVIAEALLKK